MAEKNKAIQKKKKIKSLVKNSKRQSSIRVVNLPPLNDDNDDFSDEETKLLNSPHDSSIIEKSDLISTENQEELCSNCRKCICKNWISKSNFFNTEYRMNKDKFNLIVEIMREN